MSEPRSEPLFGGSLSSYLSSDAPSRRRRRDVLAQHSSESESRPEEDHGADLQALYNRASKLCGGPEEAQQVIFSIQKIFAAEAGLRECQADRALLVDRR